MGIKDEILKELPRVENVVTYEPVKLASGLISEYYIDIKKLYGYPVVLYNFATSVLLSIGIDINNFSCVIGSGYGGIPLATTVFLRSRMKLSMFRDNLKEHGKPSMFDGYPLEKLNKKKKLLIVDDVFTTGGSIKKIIETLPKDLTVGKIFVICNRSGIEKPMINGIEVEYLFTVEELMEAMK
jgi:orotate phosphoribosyltransferase